MLFSKRRSSSVLSFWSLLKIELNLLPSGGFQWSRFLFFCSESETKLHSISDIQRLVVWLSHSHSRCRSVVMGILQPEDGHHLVYLSGQVGVHDDSHLATMSLVLSHFNWSLSRVCLHRNARGPDWPDEDIFFCRRRLQIPCETEGGGGNRLVCIHRGQLQVFGQVDRPSTTMLQPHERTRDMQTSKDLWLFICRAIVS